MANGVEKVQEKIHSFKRKYYQDLFVKGSLLTLTILISYFLLAALLEHVLWLDTWARFVIFLSFIAIAAYCVFRFLRDPLLYYVSRKGLGDEQSAQLIGRYLPGVEDKLVNFIQLAYGEKKSALAFASIEQKSQEFEPIAFDAVIDLSQNKKYLKYLAIPVVVVLVLMVFNQQILTQSASRIVRFNEKFSPQAPFNFIVQNKSLVGFFNEDFTFNLKLDGNAIPENAYLVAGDQRLKMQRTTTGEFHYIFDKLQAGKKFQVEAAGFYSPVYEIILANRPELTQFNVELEYPRYLQRSNEKLTNAGNLEVPEGTVIRWTAKTAFAQKASILFGSETTPNLLQLTDNQLYTYSKGFFNPDHFEIILENEHSKNSDRIAYRIDVIKDQFPTISVNNFKDSVLYKRIILGGNIGDDYGVTQLALEFHVKDSKQTELLSKRVAIPISANQLQQSYFFNWNVDSLNLKPGDRLEYALIVWDNDGVNGRKATRSSTYTFFIPDKDQLITEISNSQAKTEQKIEESVSKAQELQNKIEDTFQKLKGKQNLDWQDKKKIEDILEQKKDLDKLIQQMKEQNKLLEQKKENFTEQDERIREKAEQLQKLMEELLDEETRKLMEELEKLLRENTDMNELQRTLDKLNQNSQNLEKELERALELFKQLQFESKVEQTINDLKQQLDEQKSLLDKTEKLEQDQKGKNKNNKGDESPSGNEKQTAEELAAEQEKLAEDFKKTEDRMEELRELSKELDQGEIPEENETNEIQQQQQQSKENLEQNNPSKSKESQQKAIQKMQQLKEQMENMQSSMSMEMDMQNLESLRQILHGLIKLSFDQEKLIDQFRELQPNDPRFNPLAQQQIKLKDDFKVLEDSLLSLAKRDVMMGSFVTKEVTEINSRFDKTISENKERRRPQALSEMQFAMTGINNLALMLDSHFDMMMQMMANAKPSMKKGKQKGKEQNLSQLQQQLNERIEQLKNSGKSGRELSEELAKMAAEQERIRRALQEMQEKMKQEGGQVPGNELPGKMEQTETELVNKQITEQMIRRQREILTRLLEAEKSMREQNLDEERKGETAKEYDKEIPKAVEEYLRLKEKEVELLKTVPPKLYPFYKKEVSEYFKRLDNN